MHKIIRAQVLNLRPFLIPRNNASLLRNVVSLTSKQKSVVNSRPASTLTTASRPIPIRYPLETLVDMQQKSCELYKDRPAFGSRIGNKFEWMSYGEFGKEVAKFRRVLTHHNIRKGDSVAVISNNRVEWAVVMYAVVSVGAAVVPMYEAQLQKDWEFIISDSDSKLIVVANEKIYEKTKSYINKLGKVSSILSFDSESEYMYSYKRWMGIVENEPPVPAYTPLPSDTASIIYTSGTTGKPKGVELTHENLCSNVSAAAELWKGSTVISPDNVHMAFLPWAHIYGQTTELHGMVYAGASMGIIQTKEQILESLPLVRPTLIMAVPTLFNKIYDGILKKVESGSPLKQKIFHTALRVSRDRNARLERGETVGPWLAFKHRLADKIVFSKIREFFGGRLMFMASGGAATSVKVLQFFEDIGIPITEGYGLTETSPVIASSKIDWSGRRLGTVGLVYSNLTVKLLDAETLTEVPPGGTGEICVHGPSVTKGYRNNAKANEESFIYIDGKRYFRTGDLGSFVDGKFLKLTGRIKEQFKLENGKYVVPAPLEDALCRSRFVAQALLVGSDKPYTVALLVPELVEVRSWAVAKGIKGVDLSSDSPEAVSALFRHETVIELLSDELMHMAMIMKGFERPDRWGLISEPFSTDNQMLTPKMSMRRNNIMKAYQSLIDGIYAGTDGYKAKASPTEAKTMI